MLSLTAILTDLATTEDMIQGPWYASVYCRDYGKTAILAKQAGSTMAFIHVDNVRLTHAITANKFNKRRQFVRFYSARIAGDFFVLAKLRTNFFCLRMVALAKP